MKDSFGREINYLRLSLTDFCNFRCAYCMPKEGVEAKKRQEILTLEEIYAIARHFVQMGVSKLRLTGGEPMLRPGHLGLIFSLSQLESLKDLAMTTNGSFLSSQAQKLKEAGLKRVNISLDSLKADVFKEITHSDLGPVLEGIDAALECGLKVKINTVLLKGINEGEIEDFARLTLDRPLDVRFIELMPLGERADFSKKHFLSCDRVLDKLELVKETEQIKGSAATLYRYKNGLGKIGLISPLSCNFCGECNRLRLSCEGKLRPCLHSDYYVDLLAPLRRGEDLTPYILEALENKPLHHFLKEGHKTKESMHRIGG
ncbi:MAG TPA: GTP 3',8-cyclase MoaA [Clostridia bacterium]|nr:GTP 3',8-cyclase MoaA [Clostridia bacterium]